MKRLPAIFFFSLLAAIILFRIPAVSNAEDAMGDAKLTRYWHNVNTLLEKGKDSRYCAFFQEKYQLSATDLDKLFDRKPRLQSLMGVKADSLHPLPAADICSMEILFPEGLRIWTNRYRSDPNCQDDTNSKCRILFYCINYRVAYGNRPWRKGMLPAKECCANRSPAE